MACRHFGFVIKHLMMMMRLRPVHCDIHTFMHRYLVEKVTFGFWFDLIMDKITLAPTVLLLVISRPHCIIIITMNQSWSWQGRSMMAFWNRCNQQEDVASRVVVDSNPLCIDDVPCRSIHMKLHCVNECHHHRLVAMCLSQVFWLPFAHFVKGFLNPPPSSPPLNWTTSHSHLCKEWSINIGDSTSRKIRGNKFSITLLDQKFLKKGSKNFEKIEKFPS